MKLHTALLTLTLLGHSRGQCPSELTGVESISSTLTMYYALVLSDSEPGILCARFESQSEAWLGWGINPSGEMIGGEAVIGLPDEGTVRKFNLYAESMDGVVEMDDASQTLMETSIVQENGMTIMSFAKYLDEDQYGIFESGRANSFIWAVGSSNTLGYHPERGHFELEFAGAAATSTSSSVASVTTSPFATSTAGTTTMGFTEGNTTLTPAPVASEVSTDMPVAAISAPTYSPTLGDVTTTYSPTSGGQVITPSPSVMAEVGNITSAPTLLYSDSVTTSSTAFGGANVEWATPTVGNGPENATTPSPSVFEYKLVSTNPTSATTESSTTNSTVVSTESTANATSNSTDSQFSPGDFASDSASRETGNSAVSSHSIGGLVLGAAALAIVFRF
eukprot:CCRYP_013208-RA/>CCRYP_013208-RA protein AED:0.12 eAED:0.12 QI:0/0/0.5/1/0/0/2/241/391